MKTREDELRELIDIVIKLTWTFTVFRALFKAPRADSEIKVEHPELFLTMHDSLFCSFCVMTEILYEEKRKATSLWSLIRQAAPSVSIKSTSEIKAHKSLLKRIGKLRNQVCAHRWQAKSPDQIFAEVKPGLSMMTEIINLSRSIILDLAKEIDVEKASELERQQLSESTLNCIADDASQILRAFRS